jgi:hypothetical protein
MSNNPTPDIPRSRSTQQWRPDYETQVSFRDLAFANIEGVIGSKRTRNGQSDTRRPRNVRDSGTSWLDNDDEESANEPVTYKAYSNPEEEHRAESPTLSLENPTVLRVVSPRDSLHSEDLPPRSPNSAISNVSRNSTVMSISRNSMGMNVSRTSTVRESRFVEEEDVEDLEMNRSRQGDAS